MSEIVCDQEAMKYELKEIKCVQENMRKYLNEYKLTIDTKLEQVDQRKDVKHLEDKVTSVENQLGLISNNCDEKIDLGNLWNDIQKLNE